MPEEKKGLNNTTIALMVSVALFYDLLQVPLTFLFMGWLVTIFAIMTFYVWFKMKGLSFTSPKKAMLLGGGFVIELIPLLNVLPTWTLTIVLLALDSKIKKALPASIANTISPTKKQPMTQSPQRKYPVAQEKSSSTAELKKTA